MPTMKVTIQNGAAHGLSRRDVEAAVALFPARWSRRVAQIVLYQAAVGRLEARFYPQGQALGLFWPAPPASASKTDGLMELLLALSIVDERGELPARLSPALRQRHLSSTAPLLARCRALVGENAD